MSPNNDFQPDAGFGLIFISGSQYTLSGNEATLTGGLVSTGADNAVDLNIVLGANEEIANDSSNTLVVGAASGGNIDLLGYTLTIGGESYGTTDLNGVISGTLSGGLVVSPNAYATVVLAGPNDYQGTTQILSGTLVVSNATALGAADGAADEGTTLTNGATLKIAGPLTISNELLTVVSSGNSSNPVLISANNPGSGVNVWTGGINTSADEFIVYSASGSLEMDGTIAGGANAEVAVEGGPIILKGVGSSVAYFYDFGSSSVQLYGSLAVSDNYVMYDGGTTQVIGSLNAHTAEIYNGTTMEVDGTLTCLDAFVDGTLSGVGTITAASSSPVYVQGQVAPGNAFRTGNPYRRQFH